ncbi:hypothetical protein [Desulfosporosinus acididurans]|nr:hypothetical protein [Desulfosporosinus acididurans]
MDFAILWNFQLQYYGIFTCNFRYFYLTTNSLDISEIRNLDDKEYPEKIEGIEQFVSQNIGKCIELSDVHLYNPANGVNNFNFLKVQLVRYLSLIMHPGLISPTHQERCMQIAYNAKLNSGCLSRQVGVVVTDEDYSVKSIGWNSVAEGQTPCNLRDVFSLISRNNLDGFSNFETNDEDFFSFLITTLKSQKVTEDSLNGRTLSYCFKDAYNASAKKNQVHTRALHAEENAFLQISKYGGYSIKGGYLFTTASPCELCAKKAYQLGIKVIFFIDPYPGISNSHILKCGTNRPELNLFYGAIGRAYHQFYTPIVPLKDELEMVANLKF